MRCSNTSFRAFYFTVYQSHFPTLCYCFTIYRRHEIFVEKYEIKHILYILELLHGKLFSLEIDVMQICMTTAYLYEGYRPRGCPL